MKKLITMMLALCLVLSMVPMGFATETATETTAPVETTEPIVREPDQCGEDLRWKYENGTLTISGSGTMDDYTDSAAPWKEYKDEIEKLVLSGVTYIGAEAFRDFDKLKEIEFGYHIKEFGYRAFYGCDGLETLELPMSFKVFGEESLRGCKNLKEIHCDGGFPSFRLNCLWESYVTIYFPADRPWPVSLIQELEEAFHGRIEFMASDGTDPYTPEEETKPTEEATVPPTTVPPTEAPTTAPTEAPTEAVTEAPTEPETQAPAQTEEVGTVPTEKMPEKQEEPVPSEPVITVGAENGTNALKIVVTVLAVAVVLTVAIALILIFRRSGKRGRYEY